MVVIIPFMAIAAAAAAAYIPQTTSSEPEVSKRDGGTCTGGLWVTPVKIPQSPANGNDFCETGWGTDYLPITNMTVWSVENYVKGLQATYADGSKSPVIGQTTDYRVQSIGVNYALGETWTQATLYGPPNNGIFEHLTLKNSQGDRLNAGEPVSDGITPHDQPVGSGILIGFYGQADNVINSLALLFLQSPIKNVDVSNLNFPNGPQGDGGINPDTLARGHFYNTQDSGNTSWTFTDSKAVTSTYTYTQTSVVTNTIMQGFTLTAKIPFIDVVMESETTTFVWTYTEMYANAVTTTTTNTVTWGESGSLAPQTGVDTAAVVGTGAGTYEYTSDVKITLEDGTSYAFSEIGYLSLSDVSSAIVTVATANHP